MERVIKDGKMFRSLLILFSILISVLFLCSSEGLTDEAFIGYGGGGYNGKLMIFSIPGLELLK
ncbi:MAG: hypothetical protein AABZ11_08125, partial [Nitrospinota bacterium]